MNFYFDEDLGVYFFDEPDFLLCLKILLRFL